MRLPIILAAIVQIQPIVSEDVLEPSVRNEVDHALSLAAAAMSTNSPTAAAISPSPAAAATNSPPAAFTPNPFAIAATNSPPAAFTPNPFAIAATNSPTAAAPSPIAAAPTNAFAFVASPTNAVPGDIFGTNGLSATEIAIKLVSSQRADGRWLSGTNDVTATAIQILLSL